MSEFSRGQRAHLLARLNQRRLEPRIIGTFRLYEKTVSLWSFCLQERCPGHASCIECVGAWCDWYRRKNAAPPAASVRDRRLKRVELRLVEQPH